MTVEYTNRKGKTYYLYTGQTKTGKPRYFFSGQEKGKGEVVKDIPEGYEIYEHPTNAQVFLRKKRPQLITDLEQQLVKKHTKNLKLSRQYLVDCKNEYITIYESSIDSQKFRGIFPAQYDQKIITAMINQSEQQYTPMLRFCLGDQNQRIFIAERYCFLGAIDDWIYLDGPDSLDNLVEKCVPLLGTENFFTQL